MSLQPAPRLREYLRQARGLSDPVIDRHLLGWNGSRITIPIFDRHAQFAFFKLARGLDDRYFRTPNPHLAAMLQATLAIQHSNRLQPQDCER
jgi:hypothetical protein